MATLFGISMRGSAAPAAAAPANPGSATAQAQEAA